MGYFLGVDVSAPHRITLRLCTHEAVIAREVHEGDYKLTEKLLFFVDQFLMAHDLGLHDLAGVIAVTGPGQFTSLRLMCTTLNMLAQMYALPTYGAAANELSDDASWCAATLRVREGGELLPLYDKEPNITYS